MYPSNTMSRLIKENWCLSKKHRSEVDRNFTLNWSDKSEKVQFIYFSKNGHRQILFTNENILTVEEKSNRQIGINAHSSWEAADKNSKSRNRISFIFSDGWWRVSFKGVIRLRFYEQGIKTRTINY